MSETVVKHLYRSRKQKQFAGVCGGLAEYFEADVTMIRLLWVMVTILTGIIPGLLAYIVAAAVVPLEPDSK
ncbi:MAG TPA: PspC domain-containing protein [Candidatus Saccharimonadales bacterium]